MAAILLILSRKSDRQLLVQHLASDHCVRAVGPDEALAESFDLAIVDTRAFKQCSDALHRYRQQQNPVFTPVVLLLPRQKRGSGGAFGTLWDQVDEVIQMPATKRTLNGRLANLLERRRLTRLQQEKSDSLATMNDMLQQRVQERTHELRDSFIESVYILTRAAEHRDKDTGAHVLRIGHYCKCVASRLGTDATFQDTIFHAAPMHDVGKIGVPDSILLKPGRLTADEWETMKSHTTVGAAILSGGSSPYLKMGEKIAATHHECWGGGGYPKGLAGEDIPLASRIMSVADVYDALRSKRPYKDPIDHMTAMRIITEGDDRTHPGHFDPDVLQAFVKAADQIRLIFESFQDG